MNDSIKNLYDIEKHIDIEYIENIIKNNQGKKIICFGGGTAADILMQKLLYKYETYCFLDNDKSLHGTKLHGVEIKSPEILKGLKQGSFLVFIISRHVSAISSQLEETGLKKDQDYFDIYNRFLAYFRIKKFVSYAGRFEEFIDRIPDGALEAVPVKNTEKIGIVCIAGMLQLSSWYPIAQCILLRYKGYQTSLVIDCLHSFDDYIYFDGITRLASIYIDYIVGKVKKKWPSLEVYQIDSSKKENLDNDDMRMAKKFAPVAVKWFDSHRDEVFLAEDDNRIIKAEEILKTTMESIKYFFSRQSFDVISVHTGIHRHRYVYTYLGKKLGMRTVTYDGDVNGTTINETDGVSRWAYDIPKLIDGSYYTSEEKERLIEMAKANFNKRRNSTAEAGGYNYQKVKNTTIRPYDVIIPLNIMWDSAALGLDDVFENEVEWLQQTLKYLMEKTNASVMVREHPAQRFNDKFLYRNYSIDLPIINNYPERITYVGAADDINTYQYIEACKVVLPYSSTVGLEAVMLNKPIVVHTNVYYGKYVYKANNKEDYLKKIKYYLTHSETRFICNDNIYLAYLFQMFHLIKTRWSEAFDEWLDYSLDEIDQLEGVDNIIDIIISDIPATYSNLKKYLNNEICV